LERKKEKKKKRKKEKKKNYRNAAIFLKHPGDPRDESLGAIVAREET